MIKLTQWLEEDLRYNPLLLYEITLPRDYPEILSLKISSESMPNASQYTNKYIIASLCLSILRMPQISLTMFKECTRYLTELERSFPSHYTAKEDLDLILEKFSRTEKIPHYDLIEYRKVISKLDVSDSIDRIDNEIKMYLDSSCIHNSYEEIMNRLEFIGEVREPDVSEYKTLLAFTAIEYLNKSNLDTEMIRSLISRLDYIKIPEESLLMEIENIKKRHARRIALELNIDITEVYYKIHLNRAGVAKQRRSYLGINHLTDLNICRFPKHCDKKKVPQLFVYLTFSYSIEGSSDCEDKSAYRHGGKPIVFLKIQDNYFTCYGD